MRIVGISGSLRERSYSRALLKAATELVPEGMQIETFDISGIPLYNGDLDTDETRPPPVARLKETIAASDGMLFATPEYNYSVPGVLKNAIDWASRPGYKSVLVGKPVAVLGTSSGPGGTSRAQGHLRQILFSTLAVVVPHPEVLIPRAREKFDDDLNLTDEATRKAIGRLLEALHLYTRQVAAAGLG